jgi:SAM-dependent methyltransferase
LTGLCPQPSPAEWDAAAAGFDAEADHGLRDPAVRAAWTELLRGLLPPPPAALLDVGCGTGSLSLVLAELGYAVTGVDASRAMLAQARAKAGGAGHAICLGQMDAAWPGLAPGRFGALVCRHVLWALPEPSRVLARWVALLGPGGRLCLVEGFWSTGAGLRAQDLRAALPPAFVDVGVHDLSLRPALWGRAVADERYALTAAVAR